MRDEGIIKFQCRWHKKQPEEAVGIDVHELVLYRNRLHEQGLIGVYPDGIGYGNISIRSEQRGFIISGSQTGSIASAEDSHFARVTAYSISGNMVECEGLVAASSESLTHAMIYELFTDCSAVIHIHNTPAWLALMDALPTTRPDVPYGTREMAEEIARLSRQTDLGSRKILVMKGHEDGILTFGCNLSEAYAVLRAHLAPLGIPFTMTEPRLNYSKQQDCSTIWE